MCTTRTAVSPATYRSVHIRVSGLDSIQGGLAVGKAPLCRCDISLHALPSPSQLRQQCLAIGARALGCGDVCISGVDATLHCGQQTFALRDLLDKETQETREQTGQKTAQTIRAQGAGRMRH